MIINKFEDVIGNVNTVNILRKLLEKQTFPQFSIMCGNFGTGKSSSAHVAAMSLTCDNPVNGSPCGVCPTCKQNQKAFLTTGESSMVKVINLGILLNKEDVKELIRDVFVLQSGSKPRVYIFEEAHVLKGLYGAQTALLEEIDRIQKNTYVIMCTTRKYDLLPELVSRAMCFNFKLLNEKESRMLIKRSVSNVPDAVADMIVKHSSGIPRQIIKSVEFIVNNDISEEEYREYISDIDDSVLILLFQSMLDTSISTYKSILDGLTENRSQDDILVALKEFITKMVFCIEGAETSFSAEDATNVKKIFKPQHVPKLISVIDSMKPGMTMADLKLNLFKCRMIIQDRRVSDVVRDVPKIASVEKEKDKMEVINREKFITENPKSVLKPLSQKIHSF